MIERIQRTYTRRDTQREQEAAESMPSPTDEETRQKKLAEIDDVLDDIEAVLDENAEEFVQAYIQKGGE